MLLFFIGGWYNILQWQCEPDVEIPLGVYTGDNVIRLSDDEYKLDYSEM